MPGLPEACSEVRDAKRGKAKHRSVVALLEEWIDQQY